MGEKGSPLLVAPRTWTQHGESGMWASEWIPHIGVCMDDIAVIRSCWTNGINHSGGVCQMNTCINVAGRPALGSWIHYGLGSANQDLPAFVAMTSRGTGKPGGQPLYDRLWGSGFLPSRYHLRQSARDIFISINGQRDSNHGSLAFLILIASSVDMPIHCSTIVPFLTRCRGLIPSNSLIFF